MSTEELAFDVDAVDAVTEAALEAANAAGAEAVEEAKADSKSSSVLADGGITLEDDDSKDPSKAHETAAAAAAAIRKTPSGRANQPKKRNRRVGQYGANKAVKSEESSTPGGGGEEATETVAAAAAAAVPNEAVEQGSSNMGRVVTKHDEKWNERYDQLLEYKAQKGNTMVPQCYHDDQRLGRWVHYQRVEYWIFQQSGSAKITKERIAKLNAIGFEWDPQQAQWNIMFEKLKKFKEENTHCRVPKGYDKDPLLANWVRNQRLEEANQKKGKKSRMTKQRKKMLDDLDFRWSNPTPSRAKNKPKKNAEDAAGNDENSNMEENGVKEEMEEAEGVQI